VDEEIRKRKTNDMMKVLSLVIPVGWVMKSTYLFVFGDSFPNESAVFLRAADIDTTGMLLSAGVFGLITRKHNST